MMGNEAFAHAALCSGVRVAAGYPGTPSSEVIETIASEHAAGHALGIHVEWSTNEKAALELLAGASYAGARTLFTAKQVGLNVASDALMSLNYVGINGGMVLFVADDPGPISSQTEQDTRRFGSFAKVPVLDPATPEQGCAMIEAAFELSEAYKTPVIVRPTTRVCHASTFFEFPETTQAKEPLGDGFEKSPRWVIFPKRAFEGHGEINERLPLIAREFSQGSLAVFNTVTEGGTGTTASQLADGTAAGAHAQADADAAAGAPAKAASDPAPKVGIMAGGVSAMYATEALSMLASLCAESDKELPRYRFMQVGTPYPFPEEAVARFVEGLDQVIVLEELDHFLEDHLLAFCGKTHGSFDVFGKLNGWARDRGENTVDDIACRLARFFGLADDIDAARNQASPLIFGDPLPMRPPVLCAGCPHRGSFYAVKKALGKTPAVLCGDIGCYTLGNAMPLDMVDTCLCMGAGISMAQGFSLIEPGKKTVAFVGDSTFFASGLTGLVNAVYNQHDITVFVLDNATTAMTGAQPHPGTGATLMGPQSNPISIEGMLEAIGFACIERADAFHLEESVQAASRALDHAGPSAVIYTGPCISLAPPQKPVTISAEACTGCRKCLTEIGCPGLTFDQAAGIASVEGSLCNGCGLCVQVCPFSAIEGLAGHSDSEESTSPVARPAVATEGGGHD